MFNKTTEPSAGKVAISAPDSVKAGLLKVLLKNAGKQPHDALLVRVDANHAQRELVDTVSSQDTPSPAAQHWLPHFKLGELQEVKVG